MKHLSFIGLMFFILTIGAEAQPLPAPLEQAVADVQAHPDDARAREKVIALVQHMKVPPSLPPEVHEIVGAANYAIRNATSEADLLAAAEAYGKAQALAPWVPGYYFNQGIAYEKAQRFDQAITAFGWYLKAAPKAKDVDAVRERIGGLKYAKTKAEQQPPQPPSPRQPTDEELVRSLDGVRYVGQVDQSGNLSEMECLVRGGYLDCRWRMIRYAPDTVQDFPIGIWFTEGGDLAHMLIDGRVATQHLFADHSGPGTTTFTIGDDGGSLIMKQLSIGGSTFLFQRR